MNFDKCFSFENLLKMHQKCRRSKTHKKEVVGFELNLGENLVKICSEIQKGYKVSKYKTFNIFEPKKRVIEALPYKDRLVQMALCTGIVEPVLEKKLIFDNAACRKGKGTDFALDRLKKFLMQHFLKCGNKGFFLKIDISKYFASINHDVLKVKLKKTKFDEKSLNLMVAFIDSKNSESGVGLPLGNQTSQWFALLYLDEIDRLIKEKLRIKYYIRYMDDLILVHESADVLKHCKSEIERVCQDNLYLRLNNKTQIGRLCDGIDFLGFRNILTDNGRVVKILRQQAKYRLKKKLKLLRLFKEKDFVGDDFINIRLNAFSGHVLHSDSLKLFEKLKIKNGF